MLRDDMLVEIEVKEVDIVVHDIPKVDVVVKSSPDVIVLAAGNVGLQGGTGLTGPQGPMGEAEEWHSGAGAPANSLGVVGDWYLNQSNGDVHEKIGSAVWTLRGNIKGPKGDTGNVGPATPLPPRLLAGAWDNPTSDPDNASESGWYWVSSDSANVPYSTHWVLHVIAGAGTFRSQTLYAIYGNEVWTRVQGGGAFTPWQKFILSGQAAAVSDWNAAINSGWYSGNNVPNAPPSAVNTQFFGEVINWSDAYIVQILYVLTGGAPEVWTRQRNNNVWGSWTQTYPSTDASAPPVLKSGRLATNGPLIADANSPKQNGWYRLNNGVNGPPGSVYGLLMHQDWDGMNGHSHQIYQPMNTNQVWSRNCSANVWGAWVQIYPVAEGALPLRLSSYSQSIADFNNGTSSGWYSLNQPANAPPSGIPNYWMLSVTAFDPPSGHTSQMAYGLFGDEVWFRRWSSGVWQSWQKVYPAATPPDLAPGGRLGPFGAGITDWNNATSNGYYMGMALPNQPVVDGGWWLGEVVVHNGSWITQRAWAFTAGAGSPIYERRCLNGSWSAWVITGGGGGGATVATTVAGLGTKTDGKIGHLRCGSSPYDFVEVIYDASYGKWVSREIGLIEKDFGGGYQFDFWSVIPWRAIAAAGLTPEAALDFSESSSYEGGDYHMMYYLRSCGVNNAGQLIGYSGNSPALGYHGPANYVKYITTSMYPVPLPGYAADMLMISAWLSGDSGGSNHNGHARLRMRWVG